MALSRTHADPKGIEVPETRSRTSYTVNLMRESPDKPSDARKLTVFKKAGLLLL